jgi:toxin-antitoxin system PIN domain toxin
LTALLDVSVLIGLLDVEHIFHSAAELWFRAHADDGWATCPITENGFIRIVSHRSYANRVAPDVALNQLREMCLLPGHTFWPDDLSLRSSSLLDALELRRSEQVTDVYLLALAAAHGGVLATFDGRLKAAAVRGGSERLVVIGH